MRIKLKVIAKPSERTWNILEREVTPVISGDGEEDYVCGNCGIVLAKEIRGRELVKIKDVVIRCPRCGRYNTFLW